jgi:two-component system chemotaxis response regulator CheY
MQPHKILITDDSMTIRRVVKRTLGMAGYDTARCREAADGQAALDELTAAATAGEPYELCLLDLNMPRLTGHQLAAQVKGDPKFASLKIVIVSSESVQARVDEMQAKGVFGYVKKPFTPEQIRDVVESALGPAAQAA